MKDGFGAGDKAINILDKGHLLERLRRLRESGLDADGAQKNGQLELYPWENAYLRRGQFDQYAMMALLEEIAVAGEHQGYPITRLWANMEWALEQFPGVHDVVEYESRLNYILPKYDIATVCTYDVTKFSSSVVMDILRTHPQVIMGGILSENPFYAPPDEFLQELSGRSAAA
jgi:hypothetical protein